MKTKAVYYFLKIEWHFLPTLAIIYDYYPNQRYFTIQFSFINLVSYIEVKFNK